MVRWQDHLAFDFNVSETSPVVKGTLVTAGHICELIVDGWSWADVLRCHPELTENDIRAVMSSPAAVIAPSPEPLLKHSMDWDARAKALSDQCPGHRKHGIPDRDVCLVRIEEQIRQSELLVSYWLAVATTGAATRRDISRGGRQLTPEEKTDRALGTVLQHIDNLRNFGECKAALIADDPEAWKEAYSR